MEFESLRKNTVQMGSSEIDLFNSSCKYIIPSEDLKLKSLTIKPLKIVYQEKALHQVMELLDKLVISLNEIRRQFLDVFL